MKSDNIPKLAADGSNWAIYHERMVLMLDALGLVDHLTDAKVPKSGADAETVDEAEATIRWESDDATVKLNIDASVPDVAFRVAKGGTTSAKDIWHNLKMRFETRSLRIRLELERRLYSQKCENMDDVRTHFARMDSLRKQVAAAGKLIPDDEYSYLLLLSLPEAYDATVSVIMATAYISEKDPSSDVVTRLITKEYEKKISKVLKPKLRKRRHRHRSQEEQRSTRTNGEGREEEVNVAW
jgi:hypothetical protein